MTSSSRLILSYLANYPVNVVVPPSSSRQLRLLLRPTSPPIHTSALRLNTHHRFYSSSQSVAAVTTEINDNDNNSGVETVAHHHHHPWPEWLLFVDRLNAKGYFSSTQVSLGSNDYKDMNLMRNASLNFARHRLDIFKSLSVQYIQAVVERGCPNVLRKSVNSGKRLRLYLQLHEPDVCSTCLLRGCCDRANVIPKESEAEAGTVDVVRILLAYALDSAAINGGQKSPAREHIELSAKKLLLELIELSDKPPTSEFSKPTVKALDQTSQLRDDKISPDVEFKRGDWMCPKCDFMNFSRNVKCRECGEDGPKKISWVDTEIKKGDWICPDCSYMNFSRNIRCLKCEAGGPKRVGSNNLEMKKGDWNCPQCKYMNFASNKKCKCCQEERPNIELRPGDWQCSECGYVNYAKNVICRKCDVDRPKEKVERRYEDQLWRKPS